MDSSNSSKSYRVRDVLPSFKPSFVSLISVFVCGILWLKNETTNDRLIALENRMNMFPLEVRVESGSPKENFQPLNVKPTTDSVELLIKKIQTPFTSRIDYTAGLVVSVIIGKNKNYLTNLINWLSPVVQSVNSDWERCWRASVDGWAASTFHAKCDGKGPTVTIMKVGKYIFGGYTSLSWNSSSGQWQYDSKAFLYSLVNKAGWAPVKLPQTGQYSSWRYSIYSLSSYGPTFGWGHDIHVSNQASSNRNSYANLGYTYSPPSGHSYHSTFAQTFLAGGSNYHFTPDEVETFFETT